MTGAVRRTCPSAASLAGGLARPRSKGIRRTATQGRERVRPALPSPRYDWPMQRLNVSAALAFSFALAIAACSRTPDSVMWDCQLEAQKGNAGKSSEAAAERNRDIEACMRERGYRLDTGNPACRSGSTRAACYRAI